MWCDQCGCGVSGVLVCGRPCLQCNDGTKLAVRPTTSSFGSLAEYHCGVMGTPCLISSLHVLSMCSILSELRVGVSSSIKHLLVSPIARYLACVVCMCVCVCIATRRTSSP